MLVMLAVKLLDLGTNWIDVLSIYVGSAWIGLLSCQVTWAWHELDCCPVKWLDPCINWIAILSNYLILGWDGLLSCQITWCFMNCILVLSNYLISVRIALLSCQVTWFWNEMDNLGVKRISRLLCPVKLLALGMNWIAVQSKYFIAAWIGPVWTWRVATAPHTWSVPISWSRLILIFLQCRPWSDLWPAAWNVKCETNFRFKGQLALFGTTCAHFCWYCSLWNEQGSTLWQSERRLK